MTMHIKVLGPGCANCKRLFESTRQAVEELGLDASVELGQDLAEMLSYGVMGSPLLIVDHEVAMAGRVLPPTRMKAFLAMLAERKGQA